jgi:hypothetical protein
MSKKSFVVEMTDLQGIQRMECMMPNHQHAFPGSAWYLFSNC